MRNTFLAQKRKGAKKTFRNAAALCTFAPLRESSSCRFVAMLFLVLCSVAPTFDLHAQKVPTDSEKAPTSRPNRPRRQRKPRQVTPEGSTSTTVEESDRFLDLGDRFREKERWNAAESAYKESVKVWARNAEALEELGYIYLYSNRIQEAQAIYSKLRAVNPSLANDLLTEINRRKAAR